LLIRPAGAHPGWGVQAGFGLQLAGFAVTPMIGVNDTSDEIFTMANAQQLVAFAASNHLAWLSMWSGTRDQECPGGPQPSAEPTCSSIVQFPDAFMTALGAF